MKKLTLKEVYLHEISKEVSREYFEDLKARNPELHAKLEKLANALIRYHRQEVTASELVDPFQHYLTINKETNPIYTGDTLGVKMFLDILSKDTEEAGKVKTMYNNIFNSYLKKRYTKNK